MILNLADLTIDQPADQPPKNKLQKMTMHNVIYIMGCLWHPIWILQEKVGIAFYF